MDVQGAVGQGAVPRTQASLSEMNEADWAKKPEGTGPPGGSCGTEVVEDATLVVETVVGIEVLGAAAR